MANSNYSDFKEIVRDIDDRKILLPDFQRDFVWKDEERQKKIVASVLTKMPIGSILLLTSSADEYCSKIIGRNADLNTSDITGDVDFLLDGQQRITVLTNVFSNVIHDKCPRVSELVSPSLKRRFFLKIPKWIDVHNGKEADLFGIQTLAFPLANPDVDIPEFLSGEILSFIETQTFNANDNDYSGTLRATCPDFEVLPQLSVIIVISHVPQLCFKQLPATSSIHCTFYHF